MVPIDEKTEAEAREVKKLSQGCTVRIGASLFLESADLTIFTTNKYNTICCKYYVKK